MLQQLSSVALSFDDPRVTLFEAVRPVDAAGFTSVGVRGCFLSHMGVLQDAAAKGLKRILIFEDDLNFEDDFDLRAQSVIPELKSLDWSIFYGGYEIAPMPSPEKRVVAVPPDTVVLTLHFVALQGAAIGLAANYLAAMLDRPEGAPDGGPMQVDAAYCWFRRAHPHFETLITVPMLGYQRVSLTNVQHVPWYDQLPVLDGMAALWRKTRNSIGWRK